MLQREIHPFPRLCHRLELTPASSYALVRPYDHRLFYVLGGSGEIQTARGIFPLQQGDVLFIPAASAYRLLPAPQLLRLAAINFDFTSAHLDRSTPIPPDPVSVFQKENVVESISFTQPPLWDTPVFLEKRMSLAPYMELLLEEYAAQRIFYGERCAALLQTVLMDLARAAATGDSSPGHTTAERLIGLIREHYREPLTNRELGKRLGYHPNYLNRLMLEHTGVSLHQYILNYRLSRAMELLQSSHGKVGEIALATGFCDINHFSKCFKAKFGVSPVRYLGRTGGKIMEET